MRIIRATLYTDERSRIARFYEQILGARILTTSETHVEIAFGQDVLRFEQAEERTDRQYHFAINIPANRFNEAKQWLKDRVPLLTEDGEDEIYFEGIDASSVYFYDPDENVVELIARHTVNPTRETTRFTEADFLGIAEMSVTVDDPEAVAHELSLIDVRRRDGGPIQAAHLNFLGEPNGATFLLLVPPGRPWLFSTKLAKPSPIELELGNGNRVTIDDRQRLTIQPMQK